MTEEKEYVLGTHDEEIARLGLQHRVWRPRALDAWRRADITTGQTILDVGCGPGYASLDLAEIVGPLGRVVAIDQSNRFLKVLDNECVSRGFKNIATTELNLDESKLPASDADRAWVRWVFAFVKNPRSLVARIRDALKPGGALVIHEYFSYQDWQLLPRSPEFEEFVKVVMESWRAGGGEPNIGLELPTWLSQGGFRITAMNPIIDVISPLNFVWQWPRAFLHVNLSRLVELGLLDEGRARSIESAFTTLEQNPHARMITPGVLEIIAVRT